MKFEAHCPDKCAYLCLSARKSTRGGEGEREEEGRFFGIFALIVSIFRKTYAHNSSFSQIT